jgi:hypothetical protein
LGIFIGVIIVLIAMNAFFFLIFRGIALTVGKLAQNNVLRQAGVFDELILKKEQALQELQDRIDALQAEDVVAYGEAPSDRSSAYFASDYGSTTGGTYQDAGFPSEYKKIRNRFVFDRAAVLSNVLPTIPANRAAEADVAQQILDEISPDACYQLSTMTSEEQVSILSETLDEAQKALLDEYIAMGIYFETYLFLNWLSQFVFENGSKVIVRTAREEDNFDSIDSRVHTEYDEALCEGVSILSKGRLYDFSLRNREIVG